MTFEKVTAVPVDRDEQGFWSHPRFAEGLDDGGEYIARSWFTDQGLEIDLVMFENDASEELVDAWFDDGLSDCRAWEPSRPDGDGWFTFSIHDTEDGPVCMWVRHAA
ncbi:hypothetical protein [Oceanimonas smirnovii]|uniref:hypothetical protein n=1 Tax=Oceanimonas smirnovii TaxID=264574 RepID=UPI003FD0753E